MVVSPHADDEVIGCGGLISRLNRTGEGEVTVAYGSIDPHRWDEAGSGLEVLGGGVMHVLGGMRAPTYWLDEHALGTTVGLLEEAFEEFQPTCVLLPDPGGFHQEHRYMAEAVMAALRPSGGTGRWRPQVVATFEEPTDVWRIAEPMRHTWYVSLEDCDVQAKRDSLAEHVSQNRNWPSERSGQALEALARLRGAQAGVDYAEAFTVLRWLS